MNTNLVYVFLTKNFLAPKNALENQWSYKNMPEYYVQTFEHNSQKATKNYILTEKSQHNNCKKFTNIKNTEVVFVEDCICNLLEFKEVLSILDTTWPGYRQDTFWFVTFIRSIILGLFISEKKLVNTLHVEADNLLFEDLDKVFNILEDGEFGFSNEAPHASALALMGFKDEQAGINFVKQHITLLKKGENALNPHIGHFYGHVTDMAFIDLIYRARKNYKMLPCLPYGPFSENYNISQCVFDPFAYGAYLGGTNQGAPQGYAEDRHFVGREIINNKIKVEFDKRPFIVHHNKTIPVFNLHMHNKNAIPQILKKC